MKRLVLSDSSYAERLFERVLRKPRSWSNALYPPGCKPRRGPVSFQAARDESVVLHVERRDLASDDFQLRMLFATGVAVFPAPHDLYAFAKGPLAEAFGISVEEPDPPPPPPEPQLVPIARGPEEGTAEPPREAPPTAGDPEDGAEAPPRVLEPALLVRKLAQVVKGQTPALERVAHVVCTQLAKDAPARPATILLLGPTGTGKTSTIEALPAALERLGRSAHLFRVDCNELTEAFQATRLIGAPPGYVGYANTPQLIEKLGKPGCIVLLDEIDKAHPSILGHVLLNLIDTGRLTASDGASVDAADAVIAMTSNLAARKLAARLEHVHLDNRWAVQRVCRDTLAREGMPPELLGRIGAFAFYGPLDPERRREAALVAIRGVAREYGYRVKKLEPVLLDVVLDIAGGNGLGARALLYAAGELLADPLVDARRRRVASPVAIEAGPPVAIVPALR